MSSPLLDPENQTPGRKKRKFSVASNIMDDNMPDAPRDSVNHRDEISKGNINYSCMDMNSSYFNRIESLNLYGYKTMVISISKVLYLKVLIDSGAKSIYSLLRSPTGKIHYSCAEDI